MLSLTLPKFGTYESSRTRGRVNLKDVGDPSNGAQSGANRSGGRMSVLQRPTHVGDPRPFIYRNKPQPRAAILAYSLNQHLPATGVLYQVRSHFGRGQRGGAAACFSQLQSLR